MKRRCFQFVLLIFAGFLMMCKPAVTEGDAPGYEEKVFVVNTIDNGVKLNEYLQYHKQIWPEVEAGFKKAGYKHIALYRFNDLIVMTIKVPENADLDKMGKLAESYSPRCAEWNKLMNTYQQGVKGTSAGQKWAEALPFYQFKN